jgi:hypothetical protein
MPISAALHALLAAQQRVILGLGRVEEPWDVRLQCAPLLSSPSPSSFVTPAHCMHVTPCAQHAASHTVPVEVPPWSPGAPSVREVLVGWSRTLHTARVRRAQCLPSKPAVWHLPHVHAASRTPLLSLLARSMRAPHRTLLSSRSLRAACRSVPQRVLRRPEATRVCRRKQAALRQTAPHKRAALFECSAGDAEHTRGSATHTSLARSASCGASRRCSLFARTASSAPSPTASRSKSATCSCSSSTSSAKRCAARRACIHTPAQLPARRRCMRAHACTAP